jgi:hypothetical protein
MSSRDATASFTPAGRGVRSASNPSSHVVLRANPIPKENEE